MTFYFERCLWYLSSVFGKDEKKHLTYLVAFHRHLSKFETWPLCWPLVDPTLFLPQFTFKTPSRLFFSFLLNPNQVISTCQMFPLFQIYGLPQASRLKVIILALCSLYTHYLPRFCGEYQGDNQYSTVYKRPENRVHSRNSAIHKIMNCYLGPIGVHFSSTCNCIGFYTWIHRSLV